MEALELVTGLKYIAVALLIGFGAIGTAIGTGLSAIGAGLLLSGVSEMLYPTQTPEFEDNPQISFNFSGTQNTARAGTPVPIVYGEIFTGSVVISGDVDTEAVQA